MSNFKKLMRIISAVFLIKALVLICVTRVENPFYDKALIRFAAAGLILIVSIILFAISFKKENPNE